MRYTVPESFRDADARALPPDLLSQIKLSVLLGYGFALSLSTMGGLGPLAAFIIGCVARRRIKQSGGRLTGLKLAWWCIIFGGFWAVLAPLSIAAKFLR